MIAEHVIDKTKRTETGEIIVTLFEFCDINCLFCNQDHNSVYGIDMIPDKIHQIKKAVEALKLKGKTNFAVNIMGGEVFSDKLDDSVFDRYKELVELINKYAHDEDLEIKISFTTNFIWTKEHRVKNFLNETGVKLFTSYDPSGRFNTESLELFDRNVRKFTYDVRAVNIIMTKPNMEKFIKNQIPVFDYLYNHFEIYFDYYTPEANMNVLLPKDHELRDFMKYMHDNWPKCHPMKEFGSKLKKNMSCMDTYTIMPGGSFGRCTILVESIKPIAMFPSKKDLEQEWFDDYKCLECEHFARCSLGCFLSNHIKDARTQEECWLKEVYDYVDSKWN